MFCWKNDIIKIMCQGFGVRFRNFQRVNNKSEPEEENQKHLEMIVVKFPSCEIMTESE